MHRTRRELVAGAAALAGLALVPDAWARRLLSSTARIGPGSFEDSVASGEPSSTAVTFWSRLTTDRPRSGARLIVARDEDLRNVVAQTVVPTGEGMDHCLKARVGGLRPGTLYWYAWESGDEISPVGRTRTANASDSADPVRLAASSCQRWDSGFFTGHSHAAAQDPWDLVMFLGDYTYEYARPTSSTRPDPTPSNDLRSYRENLRMYRSDPGLRELHRLHPCAHIWDDHEVENNWTDMNPAPSPLQLASAFRASFEWLPRMAYPDQRFKIHKSLTMGRQAEVLLLDERQYRTGDGNPNTDAPLPFLGREQMDWLKARLKASPARWKVIANQHPVFPIGSGQGQPDQWPGFRAERTELLAHIEDEGIQNVVFVTGDIHCFITSFLHKDFPRMNAGLEQPVAVDYVTGSVTSSGLNAPEAAVRASSPNIQQFDGVRHGYGALDCRADRLVTDYLAGPIDRPDGEVAPIERFTQPNGEVSLSRETNPAPGPRQARAARAAARASASAHRRDRSARARRRRRAIARAKGAA